VALPKSAGDPLSAPIDNMVIELRMLINTQEQARQAQQRLFSKNHDHVAMKLIAAVEAAQEAIDRVGRFNEMFPPELVILQRNATNAAGF
jgi:hypothetical protein